MFHCLPNQPLNLEPSVYCPNLLAPTSLSSPSWPANWAFTSSVVSLSGMNFSTILISKAYSYFKTQCKYLLL